MDPIDSLTHEIFSNDFLLKPITTISAALGEFEKIRALMDYSGKDEESKLVQTAARQVYALLRNLCRLFLRRRKVVSLKLESTSPSDVSDDVRWSSYLIRRLPQTVLFAQLHDLVRPSDDAIPRKITKVKDNFTAIQLGISANGGRRVSVDSSRSSYDSSKTQVSHRQQHMRRGSLANHHHSNTSRRESIGSRRQSVSIVSQRRSSLVSVGHQSTHTFAGPRHSTQRNSSQDPRQFALVQTRTTQSVADHQMHKPSNNHMPNNMTKESQNNQSKSYMHLNGSSGHNNGMNMPMNRNVPKENLMNHHKGDEQIQINSIHATYRSSTGVIKGFEEVKL